MNRPRSSEVVDRPVGEPRPGAIPGTTDEFDLGDGGWNQLTDQSLRVAVGEHHLDLDRRRAERDLAVDAGAADADGLLGRVEHQQREFGVDGSPRKGGTGGCGHVVRGRVDLVQRS